MIIKLPRLRLPRRPSTGPRFRLITRLDDGRIAICQRVHRYKRPRHKY